MTPDLLSGLSLAETGWIVVAAFMAGLVRGFTGFGSGLVFLPVAAQVLPPFGAILTLTLMDIFGPVPILRRAWGNVDRGDLGRLLLGCVVCLPLGMWLLTLIAPEIFQAVVSLLALGMLLVFAVGLRYRGVVTRPMVAGIGGLSGGLGGFAGLPGPPVILFYISRPLPVQVIRATILLFLLLYDLLLVVYMGAFGRIEPVYGLLGLAMAVPNMAGNWLGGRLFDPGRERVYRGVAYALIAVAALPGLPFWG